MASKVFCSCSNSTRLMTRMNKSLRRVIFSTQWGAPLMISSMCFSYSSLVNGKGKQLDSFSMSTSCRSTDFFSLTKMFLMYLAITGRRSSRRCSSSLSVGRVMVSKAKRAFSACFCLTLANREAGRPLKLGFKGCSSLGGGVCSGWLSLCSLAKACDTRVLDLSHEFASRNYKIRFCGQSWIISMCTKNFGSSIEFFRVVFRKCSWFDRGNQVWFELRVPAHHALRGNCQRGPQLRQEFLKKNWLLDKIVSSDLIKLTWWYCLTKSMSLDLNPFSLFARQDQDLP